MLQRVQEDYVDEPNMPAVTAGALHGLLESLDPYSGYLSSREYSDYKDKQKSATHGEVGATVAKRFGYIVVVSVLPDGPAEKVGLRSGDILEAIASQATTLSENLRMLEAEREFVLLRKELEIAATIQRQILPQNLPEFSYVRFGARTIPCTGIGGDFYDVIPLAGGFAATAWNASICWSSDARYRYLQRDVAQLEGEAFER